MTLTVREEIKNLTQLLEDKSKELQAVERELQEKENEVRRAREEQTLLKELATINQLTLRKVKSDEPRANRMRISDDSLHQIMTLEDSIKLASKKTEELQKQEDNIQQSIEKTILDYQAKQQSVTNIKEFIGWDRYNYASRGYSNETNRFKLHQKCLAEIEAKQNTIKAVTTDLTKKIEEITKQLEESKKLEEETALAKEMLAAKLSEKDRIEAEFKSVKRINQSKEALASKIVDDYKLVKQIEGDKRIMHTEVLRLLDNKKNNEKSMLSQDQRIRQIESKLAAIAGFVTSVFADAGDSENYRIGVEEDSNGVSIEKFENVQFELEGARKQIAAYDTQLDKLDGDIEQNVKRFTILNYALNSRTAHASHEQEEKDRDRNYWNEQIQSIQNEFETEHARIVEENERLRKRIQALSI